MENNWVRWDEGKTWHALRVHLIFGRWVADGTTLCGRGVPRFATYRSSASDQPQQLCKACQRVFERESGI